MQMRLHSQVATSLDCLEDRVHWEKREELIMSSIVFSLSHGLFWDEQRFHFLAGAAAECLYGIP